jgi:hypothetical protein
MTAGACIGPLLVLAWSRADNLAGFYLLWAGIGLVIASVLYEPSFAVVAVWFERKRPRALTAVTLIAGQSRELHQPDSVWEGIDEPPRHVDGETGLAAASGRKEGQQTRLGLHQAPADGRRLFVTPDKGRPVRRQIRALCG